MLHARSDYAEIQDPRGIIPEDEPVMLFRAQDKHFLAVLDFYAKLVEGDDPASEIPVLVRRHMTLAANWPIRKTPDV